MHWRLEPTLVGTGEYPLSIVFNNSGRRAAVVEEIGIIQLEGRDVDLSQCEDPSMRMIPFFAGKQDERHMGLGSTGINFSFYRPVRTYVGDQAISYSTPFRIDDGKAQTALAIFQPNIVDFAKIPEVVVCLTVKYFDHDMNAYALVRKMMKRDQANGAPGIVSGYIQGLSIRLLPSVQPALVGHD
jgi:hypothetical protein